MKLRRGGRCLNCLVSFFHISFISFAKAGKLFMICRFFYFWGSVFCLVRSPQRPPVNNESAALGLLDGVRKNVAEVSLLFGG
jgi:hypothetical protein